MSGKLEQDIKFLPGMGPKRSELLNKELTIFTIHDLLYYFPYKYIDRSKFYSIQEISADLPYIQLKGRITRFEVIGNKNKKRLVAHFTDGTGVIDLVWFQGYKYIAQGIKVNTEYIAFGKPTEFSGKINIIHPELEETAKAETAVITSPLQAHYSTTEKLKNSFINSKYIHKMQAVIIKTYLNEINETLPEYLLSRLKLLGLKESILNIHFPQNPEMLKKAEFRLKFEELFYIQLALLKQKVNRDTKYKGHIFSKVGEYLNSFYKTNLPFELTGAQKRVIREIRKDLGSGKQMNRLLQGDVGSGKTLVALMSMLIALDNGFQACLMAPTEILARQHFNTIRKFLTGLDIKVYLLSGTTKKSERKLICEGLNDGSIHILIGTHAVIEDPISFANLGLAIIDEQHRFGVAQRAKLRDKNGLPPHILVMTATPIPRTLAMTIYGDLDVSVIDELPPGRKSIKTIHYYETKRAVVIDFIKKQIASRRQIYVVFPLIKESESLDYKALEEGYEHIVKWFPSPSYKVCVVHGKLKSDAKEKGMQEFVRGEANIMIATTVIEVGVDVPNASVMIIESAERFGLSQLHQLRGRVGRGVDQSYCLLMTSEKLSNEAHRRLTTMVRTNDGFEIAEEDLRLRGPGEIEGTSQSGMPFNLKIANLGKDGQILQYSRDIAMEILNNDSNLEKSENTIFVNQLKEHAKDRYSWSMIG